MRFAGNVIWFVFGGALTALVWLVGALLFAISIIGLPFTRAAIEMAKLSAFPFGKDIIHIRDLDGREETFVGGVFGLLLNVIWVILFGLPLFLSYLVLGVVCCITLIGIPWGLQCFKLAGISLWPVGYRVVSSELADAARRQNAVSALGSRRR